MSGGCVEDVSIAGSYIDNWRRTFSVKQDGQNVTFTYQGSPKRATLSGNALRVPGWAAGKVLQNGSVKFSDGGLWTKQYPVTLRVYEIGQGAYHAAVEVHGQEWQYGQGDEGGIVSIEPGSVQEVYRRQLKPKRMGHTTLTKPDVHRVVQRMNRSWKAHEYNLIHQNCCHFSRRFLQELGADSMPEWVDGWTDKVAPTVEAVAGAAASRGLVLGAELIATRGVTMAAGPAAWGAAGGDLVGSVIGDRVGGAAGGASGAEAGREVGGFSGSVAIGAGVGAICGGPVGAGIGAGVGVASWGVGKLVRTVIGEAPKAVVFSMNSVGSRGDSES